MVVNCCEVCALFGLCHDPRLDDNNVFWDVIDEWGVYPLMACRTHIHPTFKAEMMRYFHKNRLLETDP